MAFSPWQPTSLPWMQNAPPATGMGAPGSMAPPTASLGQRVGNFMNDNSNMLLSIGGALLNNRANPIAHPLGNVAQNAMVGGQLDKKQRQQNKTVDFAVNELGLEPEYVQQAHEAGLLPQIVTDGLKARQAKAEWKVVDGNLVRIDPNAEEPQWYPTPEGMAGGSDSYFGTPIWGQDAEGNPQVGQLSKTGEFHVPQMPEGFTPSPGVQRVDLGTAWGILDRDGNVVSTIPKDVAGEQREQEIGGAEGKRIANAPKAEAAMRDLEGQWGLVDQTIDKALNEIDWSNVGFIGSLTNAIPGTPAYDLARTLETVKANIGFDKLQSMRDNSPTGGALGQVSEFENRLLQAVRGSLEQGQGPEQIRANLMQIQRDLRALQQDRRAAFEQTYGGGAVQQQQQNPDGWQEIVPGVRIREIP